jgi:hypothetical protein
MFADLLGRESEHLSVGVEFGLVGFSIDEALATIIDDNRNPCVS